MAASDQDIDLQRLREAIELKNKAIAYKRAHRREFAPAWYPWQREFFGASATHSEVMVLAGNRTGKTMSSAYQDALDITGDYPQGWEGFRFSLPINAWILGVDNTQTKDVLQAALFGELLDDGRFTGGWIHPDEVRHVIRGQHPGLAKDVYVRNVYGGYSHVQFRSYTQASTGQSTLSFAGSSVDLIHIDEQPPDQLVGQLTIRTMTGNRGKGGLMRLSMTPELGLTELVRKFTEDRAPHQYLVGPVAWEQCDHLTPELREKFLASVPLHERDMRSKGVPLFGSGLIYPVAEERIRCDPFEIEKQIPYARVLRGSDLGINHPFANVWVAWDPQADVIYLVKADRRADQLISTQAASLNTMWSHSPVVFPGDIDTREKGSGKTLRMMFKSCGIENGIDFANPDDTNFVEPGISQLYQWMCAGQFKVFSTVPEFFQEMRTYHRDEGKIVKTNDDILDAVRYTAMMVKKHGVPIKPARAFKAYHPQVKL